MSSRADILITAQQAMNVHHRTATGGCAECKTSHPGPCPVWTLGAEVVRLVHASLRDFPPAGPAGARPPAILDDSRVPHQPTQR